MNKTAIDSYVKRCIGIESWSLACANEHFDYYTIETTDSKRWYTYITKIPINNKGMRPRMRNVELKPVSDHDRYY